MKKNARLATNLIMISAGMAMMAYASVPLYKLFCQQTGFGGTPKISKISSDKIEKRMVNIRFNSDIDHRLGWEFKPEQNSVKIHVGENALAFFKAINKEGETDTGTATYNVVPEKAAKYFN